MLSGKICSSGEVLILNLQQLLEGNGNWGFKEHLKLLLQDH